MTGLDITAVSSATAVLQDQSAWCRAAEPACAGVPREGRKRVFRSGQRRLGGLRADIRQLPHGRSRRPHVERGARSDVSHEPDRHGGPVPDVASRPGGVRLTGARPCLATSSRHHEQRHPEGRRTRDIQGAARVTWARRSVATALVVQRGLDNTPATFIANIDDNATIADDLPASLTARGASRPRRATAAAVRQHRCPLRRRGRSRRAGVQCGRCIRPPASSSLRSQPHIPGQHAHRLRRVAPAP